MTDGQRDEIIRRLGHGECAGLTCGDRDDDLLGRYLEYSVGLESLRYVDEWLSEIEYAAEDISTTIENEPLKGLPEKLTERADKILEIGAKLRKELLQ